MLNEIQTGRFNAILRKLLSMDVGAPSPTLASDVFPVIVLENDRPEYGFLGGVQNYVGRHGQAAVVGQYSCCGLLNVLGSGTLLVLSRIFLAVGAGLPPVIYRCPSTAAAITAGFALAGIPIATDTRQPVSAVTSRLYVLAIASLSSTWSRTADRVEYDGDNASATGYEYNYKYSTPWVLHPGEGIIVATSAGNIALSVGWRWSERAMELSESR